MGRTACFGLSKVVEALKELRKGSAEVRRLMDRTANAYVAGGRTGTFTPLPGAETRSYERWSVPNPMARRSAGWRDGLQRSGYGDGCRHICCVRLPMTPERSCVPDSPASEKKTDTSSGGRHPRWLGGATNVFFFTWMWSREARLSVSCSPAGCATASFLSPGLFLLLFDHSEEDEGADHGVLAAGCVGARGRVDTGRVERPAGDRAVGDGVVAF